MLIFGDIVIKFEMGFVQFIGCGSIVFLSVPGTATIYLYPLKKNVFIIF